MPPQLHGPVASGNRALPAAVSAVPGSGAAAGALASGRSEDGVYGQRARRERSRAVVCRGEASVGSATGSWPLPHVVLAPVAGLTGAQVPSQGCACHPALHHAPSWAWWPENPCAPRRPEASRPHPHLPWEVGGTSHCSAVRWGEVSPCNRPGPLLWPDSMSRSLPLCVLWLVKVWGWDPSVPAHSCCPVTCHLQTLHIPKVSQSVFASA